MQRTARLTLIFAILFAVFVIAPALLNRQFGPYPLLKVGDILDLFTPVFLIPTYWLLFRVSREEPFRQSEGIAFLVLSALWVEGQGMHLAANAIGHLTKQLAGTDVETLTHFLDETLSHYLWQTGLVGLSALLIYRQWNNPFDNERSGLGFETAGGLIHGLTYFITTVEAGTTPLGVPFALVAVAFGLIFGRHRLRQQPILTFYFVTYVVATLLFVGWGIYWGGLPEFSEVGIIE